MGSFQYKLQHILLLFKNLLAQIYVYNDKNKVIWPFTPKICFDIPANTIEFFLPVTIVVIPDVLVTNLITKLY